VFLRNTCQKKKVLPKEKEEAEIWRELKWKLDLMNLLDRPFMTTLEGHHKETPLFQMSEQELRRLEFFMHPDWYHPNLDQSTMPTLHPIAGGYNYAENQHFHPQLQGPQSCKLEDILYHQEGKVNQDSQNSQEEKEDLPQVSQTYPFPKRGRELAEDINSLRLLNPSCHLDLEVSKVPGLEKTFRGYKYPLQMRDLALQYHPHKELRKDLPYMVIPMLQYAWTIPSQGTLEFVMLVLMPVLVDYLSPLGWHQLIDYLAWMSYAQTGPNLILNSQKTNSEVFTDGYTQDLPEGWTNYLIRMAGTLNMNITTMGHTDQLREELEDILINRAAVDHTWMPTLAKHVLAVDSTRSERFLKWLASGPDFTVDNPHQRRNYLDLYGKIYSLGGTTYGTTKGLRFTIPVEEWENWEKMEWKKQQDFIWVAWLQGLQFKKSVFNNATLEDHHDLMRTIIDLMWETGAYRNIHGLVHAELRNGTNWEINNTYSPYWMDSDIKPKIDLPNSDTQVCWDPNKKGWYRSKNVVTWTGVFSSTHEGLWDVGNDKELWNTPKDQPPYT
jgi:hypothetical protein